MGSEATVCVCPSNGVVNSNCEIMSDAGVVCRGEREREREGGRGIEGEGEGGRDYFNF